MIRRAVSSPDERDAHEIAHEVGRLASLWKTAEGRHECILRALHIYATGHTRCQDERTLAALDGLAEAVRAVLVEDAPWDNTVPPSYRANDPWDPTVAWICLEGTRRAALRYGAIQDPKVSEWLEYVLAVLSQARENT